ncbi:chromatin organization modifier domain-containing protein, putative [Eimeria mitis]|uniref:Pyroglutamyl-peptidase I n=1 Tax=Eimeria mitis TaxID=44415 RepID=U6KJS2_9EIME|nr:chromatin organization modifier domain-containing protein, putative [Eimeria mitis]CDJ36507.1 chromatin organization modifier domain-containing protein, putative [Eimeria mitis]
MGLPGDGGSEKPSRLRVYLTGFGPFSSVSDNPSATLVEQIATALGSEQTNPAPPTPREEQSTRQPICSCRTANGLTNLGDSTGPGEPSSPALARPTKAPGNVELCGWEVLEVSAEAATEAVPRIHSALCSNDRNKLSVSSGVVSEAADVRETQEEREDVPTYSGADRTEEPLMLALHFGPVAADLSRQGFSCCVSDDAGCFVCNFLYFKSLQEGQRSGVASLFVHIPPFSVMSLQQQLAAALRLLAVLARKEHQQGLGNGLPEEKVEPQGS